MIDIILYIILFIIIISLLVLFMYFTYDYISYKKDIEKNFNKSESYINTNFENVINNVNEKNKIIDDKYNVISTNLSNVIQMEKINSENNYLNNNSNLFNFNNVMKKYFTFDGNTSGKLNEALYNYKFDTIIKPNLNLLTTVNAINGMTVRTNPQTNNSSNLRICDNNSVPNCINMNLYNGNFNITPENTNVNKLIMNTNTGNALASFELSTNSIYLGSGDDKAPLFINNCNLYIKNIKMIKDPTISYTNSITSKNFIDFDTNLYNNNLQNIMCYYNINVNNIFNKDIPISQEQTLSKPEKQIFTLSYNIICNNEIAQLANKGIQFTFDEIISNTEQLQGTYSQYFTKAYISRNIITLSPIEKLIPAKTNIKIIIKEGIKLATGYETLTSVNNIAYGKIVDVNPSTGEPLPL